MTNRAQGEIPGACSRNKQNVKLQNKYKNDKTVIVQCHKERINTLKR